MYRLEQDALKNQKSNTDRKQKKTVIYHTLVQRKGKSLKFNSITCRGVKKHHDYVTSLLLAGDRRDR